MTAAAEVSDVLTVERIVSPSVTRTWSDVSLLYDGVFHDSNKTNEEIDNIHSLVPELVDVEVIGQSYLGKNITCLTITNEQNQVQKAKALVVAHHHGREQITVELALRFILRLLNNYGVNDTITEYVDTQEIYIIPTLNPDALDVVVNDGNHWLRKNLRPYDNDGDGLFSEDDAEDVDGDGHISRFFVYEKANPSDVPDFLEYTYLSYEGIDNDGDGEYNEDEVGLVDLNRNYPTFWDDVAPGSDYEIVTTQVYHGTAPFSEPETQAFRDFALQHRFAMAYSLHSGTNATFFPTNLYEEWVEGVLYYNMIGDYADILPENYNYYLGYTPTATRLEAATPGGWGEWMYYERGCTVPITFEVYTNESADIPSAYIEIENNDTHVIWEWKHIYGYFNPVEEHINTLWTELTAAFDYLLEMTPRMDITITGASGDATEGSNVTLVARMECLSARLGSKEPIYIKSVDNDTLATSVAVGGAQTLTRQIPLTLSEDLDSTGYTVYFGNEYTGYTAFQVKLGSGLPVIIDPLLLAGIGAGVLIAVVVVIYWVKFR
jgi:hypothetical protein